MSSGGEDFGGVDIDLLADYVGGALVDPAEHDRVARLVADEPAWQDAYAVLSGGMARVGEQLGALGPAPMPEDVATRIDSLFAPPVMSVDAAPDGGRSGSGRHLRAVPSQEAGVRGARLRRWAMAAAVAAGVAVFAGVGAGQLFGGGAARESSATSAGSAVGAADRRMPPGPAGSAMMASGRDYQRAELGVRNVISSPPPYKAYSGSTAAPDTEFQPGSGTLNPSIEVLDPVLSRLSAPDALRVCLDAISAAHGHPVTPESIDFARFEGTPAVIVQFTSPTGTWSWVSGPDCGTPGTGADTRYQVQVR